MQAETKIKKVDEPFPQYEYTDEMQREDLKIARIVFYYRYRWLFRDTINGQHPCSFGMITKDDLIQESIMELYRFRPKHDPSKSKYTTVGRRVARRAMNRLLFRKNVKYTNKYVSMDNSPTRKNFGDDDKEDDRPYTDIINKPKIDWCNIMYYENVIDTAINMKFDDGNLRHIACMFAVGIKRVDIANRLGVSQAYISKVVKNYLTLASEIFPHEDKVHDFYKSHFDIMMEQFDMYYLDTRRNILNMLNIYDLVANEKDSEEP